MSTTTNFHGAATATALSHKDTHWLEFSDDRGNRVAVFMDRSAADARAAERLEMIGAEQTRGLEKQFMLQMIDMQWREHLVHLDHLRGVIGLRGYGQRDPLNEYKTEAFSLFENLLYDLRHNVTRWLMTVETPSPRIVTPYSASPTSMVRFWWVMTSSCELSRSSS